ncbi:ABC transporter ATP-binding protein [Bradyrhizobium sp. LHD-71]|uniref:ABC transporter ATP-binding protein n=1 Tax=Bradyrhizobium sp. LHD-71 TaxID=3072141 RepID=UPI00280D4516|nr:ABC transporter ATP-binding protein [Bradyrhizobium sp. LHD-71]MDQ8729049.1 ABC transporter ATP-binding protein [Bradyrhizobium sp. LHD-71]
MTLAAPENGSALELRALRKAFNGSTVLNEISISAGHGEFVSLVGPSGCGKTTTLNIIAGFEHPDSGDVLIGGRSIVRTPSYRRELGMVFQSHALFPHLTVFDNVGFGLAMRRMPKAEINRRVGAALEIVRLSGFETRYPRELSGGQQQRVGIARALTVQPRVILMDEPLSSLDAKLRREMQVELRRIQRSVGVTAIYVTHDQEEALTLSDRIVLMNKGVIEQAGTPDAIYSRPASEFVAGFIGEATFLDGTVIEAGPNGVSLRLPGGCMITLPADRRFSAGDTLRLAVRPDRVRLDRQAAGGLDTQVLARAFVGPFVRYVLGLADGTELAAQMPAGAEDLPQEGETVIARIKACDWLVFDRRGS